MVAPQVRQQYVRVLVAYRHCSPQNEITLFDANTFPHERQSAMYSGDDGPRPLASLEHRLLHARWPRSDRALNDPPHHSHVLATQRLSRLGATGRRSATWHSTHRVRTPLGGWSIRAPQGHRSGRSGVPALHFQQVGLQPFRWELPSHGRRPHPHIGLGGKSNAVAPANRVIAHPGRPSEARSKKGRCEAGLRECRSETYPQPPL